MNKDVDIMAKTIYGEARGEVDAGKKAIACVIMNRYKAKKWFSGRTIADTCLFKVKGSKYHQFSCWNEEDPNYKLLKSVNCLYLAEYVDIAEKFINGEYKDFTNGCTHYHTKQTSPYWAKGHLPAFEIGNHLFYNDIE